MNVGKERKKSNKAVLFEKKGLVWVISGLLIPVLGPIINVNKRGVNLLFTLSIYEGMQ